MDVLACIAGGLVLLGCCTALMVVMVSVVGGMIWLVEQLPKFAQSVLECLLAGAAVLLLFALVYFIGCDMAETLGWCASCGLG
jgi:hypothetical protein